MIILVNLKYSLNENQYTTEKYHSKIALVIGIDAYQDSALEQLPSCKKDAQDMAKLLSSIGYEIYSGSPIVGSKMMSLYGWVEIKRAINEFFQRAHPGQTVLLYFSGHGIPKDGEIYLGTPQVDPTSPSLEGIALSDLTRQIASSKSRKKVLILDGCYSGAANLGSKVMDPNAAVQKRAANNAQVASSQIDSILPPEGTCYLLSSQAYEPSLAMKNDNSLYTKYIMKGLEGREETTDDYKGKVPGSFDSDGVVTPMQLHNYVFYQVASIANQQPKMRADLTSPIILAEPIRKGGADDRSDDHKHYRSKPPVIVHKGKIKRNISLSVLAGVVLAILLFAMPNSPLHHLVNPGPKTDGTGDDPFLPPIDPPLKNSYNNDIYFQYPANWNEDLPKSESIFKFPGDLLVRVYEPGSRASILVFKQSVASGISNSEEYFNQVVRPFLESENYQVSGVAQNVNLGGKNAYQVRYEFVNDDGNNYVLQRGTVVGGNAYYVEYRNSAEDFEDGVILWDKIISTFKVLES